MKKFISLFLLSSILISALWCTSCKKENSSPIPNQESNIQETSEGETTPPTPLDIANKVNNAFVHRIRYAKSFKVITDTTDESRIDEIGYIDTVTSHSEYTVVGRGSEDEHSLALFSIKMSGPLTDYYTYLCDRMYYITDGEDSFKISKDNIGETPLEQYIFNGPVLVPKSDFEESIFEGSIGFVSEQENIRYIEVSLDPDTAEELYSDMLSVYKTEAGATTLDITSAKIKISIDDSLGSISFESRIEMEMTADQGEDVLTVRITNTSKSVYSEIDSVSVIPSAPEGIENYPLYNED